MGKVEGRQKDRGEGPRSSRTASQLKTATWPPLCSLPLPCPIGWDTPTPTPSPNSCCPIWLTCLWIPVWYIGSCTRLLSLSLF